MKTLIPVALLLILTWGCRKSTSIAKKDYSGEFVLITPINDPITRRMHVQFSGVNFTGSGDSALLPFVGTGVFKVTGDSIYFTQTGSVPEIFDRTSILEGAFLLEQNTDSLVFSRKNIEGLVGPEVKYRLHQD